MKQPENISVEEMQRRLAGALEGVTLPTTTLELRRALGSVLAVDQNSRLDLPPFDKSAMDGYAILEGDEPASYRLLGLTAAGQMAEHALEAGTTVKVMTGAPVPPGTGRVVMQELVREEDGVVTLEEGGARRAVNICRQGEDLKVGDLVLPAGRRLGPLEIANLTACGLTEVEVVRPLRLVVLSTGDEVVDHPDDLSPGKIIDTNAPLLLALAARHHLEVVHSRRIADDRAATAEAIREGLAAADVVVLSGGISEGDFDHVAGAFDDLGLELLFSGVNAKPGRPLACAKSEDQRLVVGLPGNPVAVFLMFHLCLMKIVDLLTGAEAARAPILLPLAQEFRRRKTERQEYVPARIEAEGSLRPVAYHGSAHLAALMEADGFFVMPPGPERLAAGSRVRFLPFR